MAFMEPDIVFGEWYEVETTHGTEWVPADLGGPDSLQDYCEGTIQEVKGPIEGWGARLSASGYMDCTDWTVFSTEEEARAYLEETYGTDEEEG